MSQSNMPSRSNLQFQIWHNKSMSKSMPKKNSPKSIVSRPLHHDMVDKRSNGALQLDGGQMVD